MAETIISVGIDIGTTTTQLIFSRFTIENTAGVSSVPRISIVDKRIVYESAIYITPLLSQTRIDENAVRGIVQKEYALAGIKPESVTTGAVIITGETARKENAGSVLSAMSGLAGDFVVATAGGDLESIIAGKGAGAAAISLQEHKTTANLDIGGGTTNIAVFSEGDVAAASCFDVGGRLIRLRGGSGPDAMAVDYIAPKIEKYCRDAGIAVKTGQAASKRELQRVCRWMAAALLAALGFTGTEGSAAAAGAGAAGAAAATGAAAAAAGRSVTEVTTGAVAGAADVAFLATEHTLMHPAPELITFSGGVASYIYDPPGGDFPHGDIGALLALEIRYAFSPVWDRVRKPSHTIRATVIGAGMYSTELSGSTITYIGVSFPLKNIPIIRLSKSEEELPIERFSEIVRHRLAWYNDAGKYSVAALSMTGEHNISFAGIQQYAAKISRGMSPLIEAGLPLIVVVELDMAKALGQALSAVYGNHRLVCIDGVSSSQGDYIDIGTPLMGGRVLPVVIKTLVFN